MEADKQKGADERYDDLIKAVDATRALMLKLVDEVPERDRERYASVYDSAGLVLGMAFHLGVPMIILTEHPTGRDSTVLTMNGALLPTASQQMADLVDKVTKILAEGGPIRSQRIEMSQNNAGGFSTEVLDHYDKSKGDKE